MGTMLLAVMAPHSLVFAGIGLGIVVRPIYGILFGSTTPVAELEIV